MKITDFFYDWLGDGTLLLDFKVCSECATVCEVDEGEAVEQEKIGENHVADAWAPVCEICVN